MGGAQGMPAEEDLEMLVAQMQGGLARREAGEGAPTMLEMLRLGAVVEWAVYVCSIFVVEVYLFLIEIVAVWYAVCTC